MAANQACSGGPEGFPRLKKKNASALPVLTWQADPRCSALPPQSALSAIEPTSTSYSYVHTTSTMSRAPEGAHSRTPALASGADTDPPSSLLPSNDLQVPGRSRRTGGNVLSIWAPSVVPEGTSVSSWGSSIDPGACRLSVSGEGKAPKGLIRPGGSPPRPRRTGAAGRTAALATEWPFQRRAGAGFSAFGPLDQNGRSFMGRCAPSS